MLNRGEGKVRVFDYQSGNSQGIFDSRIWYETYVTIDLKCNLCSAPWSHLGMYVMHVDKKFPPGGLSIPWGRN